MAIKYSVIFSDDFYASAHLLTDYRLLRGNYGTHDCSIDKTNTTPPLNPTHKAIVSAVKKLCGFECQLAVRRLRSGFCKSSEKVSDRHNLQGNNVNTL